jgi:hypothetical protein
MELNRLRGHLILGGDPGEGAHVGSSQAPDQATSFTRAGAGNHEQTSLIKGNKPVSTARSESPTGNGLSVAG